MGKRQKNLLHIAFIAAMAGLFQVFFVLCVQILRPQMPEWAYPILIVGGTVLNVALAIFELICYFKGKELFYKTCVSAYVLLVFFAIILYVLFRTGFFAILNDEQAFQEYLEKAGVWMGVLFVLLQFLQVVILPIPSFVTVAAGTALFGPLPCALLSLIGILIGSITAFLIGRYLGHKAVAWMIGKNTLDKWLKKIKGRDKLFLSAMFLLPIFPDDVLCFVAGISSMSLPFFLTVIVIARIIAIFTTCYSVTLIPFDTWWGIMLWVLFFVGVAILFFILYKKADVIEKWLDKKFHRETRIEQENAQSDFDVEIVSPDGNLVKKSIQDQDETENPT